MNPRPGRRLHWFILAGILAGAAWGAWMNAAYYEAFSTEAREEVRAQVEADGGDWAVEEPAMAKAIEEAIGRRYQGTALGGLAWGLSRLFLQMLNMVVIPLVFFSLVCGVAGLGDFKRLGRLGGRTLAWYLTTTMLAILTGLLLVNLFRPGAGLELPIPTAAVTGTDQTIWDRIVALFPANPLKAMVDGQMLPVIVFSILAGACLLATAPAERGTVEAFAKGGFAVMMKMTMFVIALAPVGIAALIAKQVAPTGLTLFVKLLGYAGVVAGGLVIHFAVTLPILLWIFTGRNPYRVMKAMAPALLTAFSTASSNGTMPVTLERMENGVGVSNKVTSFVIPLGATVNMDGTALYECVATLFIAQVIGLDLTLAQQGTVVLLSLAVSIGAAGIPHAGLVMMVIIFQAVGLPLEATGLLWAVDRPLDMCRTTVNVWSDMVCATAVAHKEGEIDETVLFRPA